MIFSLVAMTLPRTSPARVIRAPRMSASTWPDQEVIIGLDLPAEVAEDLSGALELKLPRQRVLAGQYRRLRVQSQRIWAPVRAGR